MLSDGRNEKHRLHKCEKELSVSFGCELSASQQQCGRVLQWGCALDSGIVQTVPCAGWDVCGMEHGSGHIVSAHGELECVQ